MRRSVLLLLIAFCATSLVAQTNYYANIEGLTKVELKRALHDMMQPERVLDYGGNSQNRTWKGFYQTDYMEGGQVRDRYSNETYYFNEEDTVASVQGMNIEHIWANSWWGHEKNNAYKDLFNLYPADGPANQRKSNNPIGVVSDATYDNGVIKVGKSASYRPDSLITVWEPADQWKGDFARTYFYMATCYTDLKNLWTTTEGWLTADMSEWPTMKPWVYNLMLQWARQDPIDEIEIQRNDVIYCIQGNRNPFIDLPQLEEYIWGTMMDSAFYADNEVIIDPIVIPVDTIETEIADFFEDFEKGSKGPYAIADVACTASTWTMADALIGSLDADHRYGTKSVRIRNGYIEMTEDYVDGCDSLTFYAGMYGSATSGANLSVYYSTDEGESWTALVESEPMGSWKKYAYDMDVKDIIRLRFVCDGGGTGGTNRINIDDICMKHYVESILIGDVNGDGIISIADVTMLVNIILGKTTEGYEAKVADVNGDGAISIADVTALVNKILGK